MNVFWSRGYDGTSLDDLLTATRLSKSSFCQVFSSKHEAFQRALTHYCDGLTAHLREKLQAADSGWDFIESVLLSAVGEARSANDPRGCMIVNVATEFSTRDTRITALVADGVKRVAQVFVEIGARAQIP